MLRPKLLKANDGWIPKKQLNPRRIKNKEIDCQLENAFWLSCLYVTFDYPHFPAFNTQIADTLIITFAAN